MPTGTLTCMRTETRTAIEQGDVGAFIQLVEEDPSIVEIAGLLGD